MNDYSKLSAFCAEETPFDFDDLQHLNIPLPEELAALRGAGRFAALRSAIAARLAAGWVEDGMRRRLVLELRILDRLEADYTVTRPQLLEELDAMLTDFDPAELERFEADGLLDWQFIEGEQRFYNRAVPSLFIIYPQLNHRRRSWPEREAAAAADAEKTRMENIMKRDGYMALRYRIRYEAYIRPEAARYGSTLRLHIPLPIEGSQMEDVKLLATSHPAADIAPADHPMRTVLLEKQLCEGDVFFAEYEVTNRSPYLDLHAMAALPADSRPAPAAPCRLSEADRARYLAEQAPHIGFTPYLRGLAQRIVKDETDPLRRACAIYDWITAGGIRYSFVRSYFATPNLPESTARNQRGDCGMQALLFITLCRICGIPARWQSGRTTNPEALTTGCHDWAQLWVEGYGWRWVDCSAGGGAYRAGNEERRRFFFGNMHPARLVMASEFQHQPHTPMRYMRFDPYDNQQGEAEYTDRGLPNGALESTTRILAVEQVK
ncbi:MAG: transglutaminase domain-containing protein [Oscillospiraceae bacterium]|nr:transglutaminase domain-containing protein [Oscillospiraceae bacterium]